MKRSNRRSLIRGFLRFLGLALFFYLLTRLNSNEVREALARVDFRWILAAFLLNLPFLAVKAYRWRMILERMGIGYRVSHAFRVFASGVFWGLATPGRSGDLVRVFLLKQDQPGMSLQTGLASIVVDRAFDVVVLCFVFSGVVGFKKYGYTASFWVLLGILCAGLLGGFWGIRRFLRYWVPRKSNRSFLERIKIFIGSLHAIELKTMIYTGIWTILAYLFFFTQGLWTARAMGLTLSFQDILGSLFGGSLVALVPVTIAGLGTRDSFILLWLRPKVTYEDALLFSFLTWFVQYAGGAVLGCIAWMTLPVSERRPPQDHPVNSENAPDNIDQSDVD